MINHRPIAVWNNGIYQPAFWDDGYEEYIIELCWSRQTPSEVYADIREGRVYADLPCKYEGK